MTILSRNWRCRIGELDIVALDNHELVCVEVKTRRNVVGSSFTPFDNIDYHKRKKLSAVFARYRLHHAARLRRMAIRRLRFDGVGVTIGGGGGICSSWRTFGRAKIRVDYRRNLTTVSN